MNSNQKHAAINACDRFFSMQTNEVSDKILTTDEIVALCERAQAYLKEILPNEADKITVTPSAHNNAETDFAGYCLKYDDPEHGFEEQVEFDFGSKGVDVQDGGGNVA